LDEVLLTTKTQVRQHFLDLQMLSAIKSRKAGRS
jgi:hypothetical protein